MKIFALAVLLLLPVVADAGCLFGGIRSRMAARRSARHAVSSSSCASCATSRTAPKAVKTMPKAPADKK